MNYSPIKWHYLALIFSMQKPHHYLLPHCLNLVTKSNPFKYLLSRPMYSSIHTAAEWIWHYYCNSKRVSKLVLIWSVALFPSEEYEPLCEDLPNEEVCLKKITNGVLPMMVPPYIEEMDRELYYMLLMARMPLYHSRSISFLESMVIGLIYVLQMGIGRLFVQGDSRLIINRSAPNFHWK